MASGDIVHVEIEDDANLEVISLFRENKYQLQHRFIDLGRDFDLNQSRVVRALFMKLSELRKPGAKYRFKAADIIKVMGMNYKNAHFEIKEAVDSLNGKTLSMPKVDRATEEAAVDFIPLLQKATYHPGKGLIDMQLNRDLESLFLLDGSEPSISLVNDEVSGFNLARSERMYEILKRKVDRKTNRVILTLDEIRFYFQKVGQYNNYADIRTRILEATCNDIKKNGRHSKFYFEFQPVTQGRRRVVAVEFTVHLKNGLQWDDDDMVVDMSEAAPIAPKNITGVFRINFDAVRHLEARLKEFEIASLRILDEMAGNDKALAQNSQLVENLSDPAYIEAVLDYIYYHYKKKDKPVAGGLTRKGLIEGWRLNEAEADEVRNEREKSVLEQRRREEAETITRLETEFEAEKRVKIERHFTPLTDEDKKAILEEIAKDPDTEQIKRERIRAGGISPLTADIYIKQYIEDRYLRPEECRFTLWAAKRGFSVVGDRGDYRLESSLFGN